MPRVPGTLFPFQLFDAAELDVLRDLQQQKFPKDLYPVRMFALRDKSGEQ